jgi:sRNA-binding protein
MASAYASERKRGAKDAAKQIAALREKWPAAFPAAPAQVRPLACGTPKRIAEAIGWTIPFTLGVLAVWKGSPSYCRAVLHHDRINLDGSPSGEQPDAAAKDMATKQLAKIAARRAAEAAPPNASPPA